MSQTDGTKSKYGTKCVDLFELFVLASIKYKVNVVCVPSQLSIMAYQAGSLEDPSALVNSISTNIQRLTLLSNAFISPLMPQLALQQYQRLKCAY